jgi:hypothetical protein
MVEQAGIGEGEPESGDEEDGPPDQLRPDADDGARASGVGEGIGSGWGHHVRHWAGLSISGVDGPRYGRRHSGPYRALRPDVNG